MKWLLLVAALGVDGDSHYDPYPLASENECIAAAEEFVRQYRAFEWHKHREKPIATLPVVRSFVKCEPEVGKS